MERSHKEEAARAEEECCELRKGLAAKEEALQSLESSLTAVRAERDCLAQKIGELETSGSAKAAEMLRLHGALEALKSDGTNNLFGR